MIPSPVTPSWRLSVSSATELQSKPKPNDFMICMMRGLGRAFTAKNSRNPSIPEKAWLSAAPVSRMPFSS